MENTNSTTTSNAATQPAPITDGMHQVADALLKNGIDKMYGVIGIPVTDVARIAQAKGI